MTKEKAIKKINTIIKEAKNHHVKYIISINNETFKTKNRAISFLNKLSKYELINIFNIEGHFLGKRNSIGYKTAKMATIH